MIDTKDNTKLLEISSKIIEILDDREFMPNGDFQGCIEAQVIDAYILGQERMLSDWKQSVNDLTKK